MYNSWHYTPLRQSIWKMHISKKRDEHFRPRFMSSCSWWWCCLCSSGTENGKIFMQLAGNDNYKCQYAYFSQRFPNSYIPVRVFTSVNQGNDSAEVHDSVLVWVEDVSTTRFKACIVAGGQGSGSNSTIDWLAFQGYQSGVKHGQARFALFTTGTKCTRVTFSQVKMWRTCFNQILAKCYV